VGAREVRQDRVLQQAADQVGIVDAAERAAHIVFQQPETGVVDVHVRPGQGRRGGRPAAHDGGHLNLGHPDRARERGQVPAVELARQAQQRGAQVRQVRLELLALVLAEEQRPGQVAAAVKGVKQHRWGADQLAGREAAPLELVEIQRGQTRSVHLDAPRF
jgi:hypothetical protein